MALRLGHRRRVAIGAGIRRSRARPTRPGT